MSDIKLFRIGSGTAEELAGTPTPRFWDDDTGPVVN